MIWEVPKRSQRTGKVRRIMVRTPSGKVSYYIEDKKPNHHRCAWCGGILQGIVREKLGNAPKSAKRVARLFGGYLCHRCLEKSLKLSVFFEWKAI